MNVISLKESVSGRVQSKLLNPSSKRRLRELDACIYRHIWLSIITFLPLPNTLALNMQPVI